MDKRQQLASKIVIDVIKSNPKILSLPNEQIVDEFKKTLQALSINSRMNAMKKFFSSRVWKFLKQSKAGHSVGYDLICRRLKTNKITFVDDNGVSTDGKELYSKLTKEQLEKFQKINESKSDEIHIVDNYICMVIGSLIITSTLTDEKYTFTVKNNALYVNDKEYFVDSDNIVDFTEIRQSVMETVNTNGEEINSSNVMNYYYMYGGGTYQSEITDDILNYRKTNPFGYNQYTFHYQSDVNGILTLSIYDNESYQTLPISITINDGTIYIGNEEVLTFQETPTE